MLALRPQNPTSFLFMVVLAIAAHFAGFGQTINPVTQITWPNVTGRGLPAAPCGPSNHGQPYTDLTSNVQYVCSASGWTQAASCSGDGPYNVKACGGAFGDVAHATCKTSVGSKALSDCSEMTTPFSAAMVGEPIYIAGAGGTSGRTPSHPENYDRCVYQ